MQANRITLPLGLPGVRVLRQELTAGGALHVVVVPTPLVAVCPRCGRPSPKVHDRRLRPKADQPLGTCSVTIVLVRRRFRCCYCERPFTEPDPICGERRRLTKRLRGRLAESCQHQTVQQVATTYGVSPATVRRALAEYAAEQAAAEDPAVVRQLGLDEFSLRKGRRYATALHDLARRRLVEVIEGRTSSVVQAALERLAASEVVEVVSMDMASAYRDAVRTVLPQAAIVVDKFHVIKRVQEALAAVWRRLAKGKGRDDPLRRYGRLVLRNREDLRPAEWARLGPLLRQYPALRHAWLLKEEFRRWYREATAAGARLELRAWRRLINALEELPEFRELNGMFDAWQEEILNYFTYRVTQGVVEGKNNRFKVIQRQAYGYRNFQNLRLRLLLAG